MSGPRLVAPERLDQDTGRELYNQLRRERPQKGGTVELDLSTTESMDSRGGAWIIQLANYARKSGAELTWSGAQGEVADFVDLIEPGVKAPLHTKPPPMGWLEYIGHNAIGAVREAKQIGALVVEAVYWTVLAPFQGRGFRVDLLMDELYEMGVRAVPINFVMNFLLGLTIAMMASALLQPYGLGILVANMMILAFSRELSAIMTAVVVSARTGAAITAEISNMKVQEEVDALRGMGLNVTQFLVAPKLLALLIAQPCLTAIGIVAGVLGGAVWGLMVLGFRPSVWFQQTLAWATVDDIMQGLLKGAVFAIIIVLVGCHNGLRVKGGSRGVGLMTTRSVVMDIFAIIAVDMVFALLLYYVLD
jgi:phospholipid/cholesterol/gamma-HCH transport system permease protein